MFDLEPGDELSLLIETARSFGEDELRPAMRDHEAARAVAPPVLAAFAQIGLAGLELPESQGGAGLGPLARVLVNEELGGADVGAALALDPLGPALYPLLELGGDEALERFAVPLLSKPGGRAVLVDTREASLEVDGDRVRGKVPYVPAERVDLLVVLGDDGAAVIEQDVDVAPLRGSGLRAAGAAALRLDGAPVAARYRDAAGTVRARARVRLYGASLLLGVLHAAAEFSRSYALEREAFGRPIAHHQGLAFLITEMRMAVDGARLLVQEAAWLTEQGLPCAGAAAAAFLQCAEAAAFVGPNGVQLLGGHGFMADYPVEKHMREARALALLFGGVDAARDDAGDALLSAPPPVALSHGEFA